MVLGVDGLRLLGNRSGVGRVLEALLSCLPTVAHPFDEVRVYTPQPLPDDVHLPPGMRNIVLPSRLTPGLWEQVTLPRAHGKRGVLLCPSYVVPVLSACPTLLIHHGSYEGHPSAFPPWRLAKAWAVYAMSAHRATLVTTVSENSRRDMARFYRLDPATIDVVPAGVDTTLFRPIDDQQVMAEWRQRVVGGPAPFLLYVGKPARRRNLPSLLEAFARLKADGRPHRLVLIGTTMAGTRLAPIVRRLGLERDVVLVGFSSHEDLAIAYNAAELFVYPSSYEGFGMPVLEAMACGTPAVALDNSAFPEFAGGVACLLPDARAETLYDGLRGLLDDPGRRAEMRVLGPQRAGAYDWHNVTRQYVTLLERLVS